MQSSLHTQISWKTPRFHRSRWNSNPKTLISATSLKSPFKFDLEEISPGGNGPAPVHLPVVIRKSGRVSRYLWDGSGNSLRLVPFDREESGRFDLGEEVQRLVATVIGAVRKLFVPRKVNGNYMGYLKWKFLHRVFSSALQVLATQVNFLVLDFWCIWFLFSNSVVCGGIDWTLAVIRLMCVCVCVCYSNWSVICSILKYRIWVVPKKHILTWLARLGMCLTVPTISVVSISPSQAQERCEGLPWGLPLSWRKNKWRWFCSLLL